LPQLQEKVLEGADVTLAQYEKDKVICPHCGSKNIGQCWSAFTAITSKESA
jgi:RNA polymerase subunit RPABC4/transcription elongation factor Spt4